MFKRKKKSGCETPKFRKPIVPPQIVVPPMPPTSGSNAVKPKKLCTYETPCGWCTKWDKKCDKKIGQTKPELEPDSNTSPLKCDVCLTRYSCEEQYEFECQNNNYRHFILDNTKLSELKKED